jgi:hypothetical protein
MYEIRYDMITGDSFKTVTEYDNLFEIDFPTKELAKKALKRIKEHYIWYKHNWNYIYCKDIKPPKWHDCEYDFQIKLEVNEEGDTVEISAPWCGYFELLQRAWITERLDPSMEISFS